MSRLNIVIAHQLSQEEALKRIKGLLGDVKVQYADKISNLQEEWEDNIGKFSFSAMGFSVSGTLTVRPNEVELDGNLPFAASFFKGKITSIITEKAEELLR
ncbi:MAG: polyhydroxyalkanoic acid system family protein [Candidatus Pacebacteria bacterium]|nr:polyhydroxyalkanoic acid system family protein [Candidatus Paceibacterota bacterium]